MRPILYYVHDPMCSWCWGFSRTLAELLENLPAELEVQYLLGGLAEDTDLSMPLSMQQQIKSNWSLIEDTIPGVKFNYEFWTKTIARRSTYPACRAIIAARFQGKENEGLMIKAIQMAYYQQARNPSDNSTLIELADEIGLSVSSFEEDLVSAETQRLLIKEIRLAQELFVESYPSLVLKINDSLYDIAIDYNDFTVMLKKIEALLIGK